GDTQLSSRSPHRRRPRRQPSANSCPWMLLISGAGRLRRWQAQRCLGTPVINPEKCNECAEMAVSGRQDMTISNPISRHHWSAGGARHAARRLDLVEVSAHDLQLTVAVEIVRWPGPTSGVVDGSA